MFSFSAIDFSNPTKVLRLNDDLRSEVIDYLKQSSSDVDEERLLSFMKRWSNQHYVEFAMNMRVSYKCYDPKEPLTSYRCLANMQYSLLRHVSSEACEFSGRWKLSDGQIVFCLLHRALKCLERYLDISEDVKLSPECLELYEAIMKILD